EPVTRLNTKFEDVGSGVTFTLDIQNNTPADVTLRRKIRIMQESKATKALHGSQLSLDKDYFLPASHATTVYLNASDLCVADYDPQACFASGFADDSEIVVFDDDRKYEVRVPIPALTLLPKKRYEVK
ncbi:MAG TPA: hypothetical protein VNR20_06205, partial [Terriglobales bacterium]|nr:hypothetical protein [Terriglobales bacterium]